jgi:bifunctional enzyme CysN/CysC
MSTQEQAAVELEKYLAAHEDKGMLRFITCGSVDDGKSTLIGRLLWDSKLILDDQLKALEHASRTSGTQGDAIDFALLLDGLQAEREQGITIDVAYRFFSTDKRKFIVADTPGHEQYTRNMATGASSADLAVILVNAEKGILTQTLRHSYIVSLVGIRNVILAVNKMDTVNYDQSRFEAIRDEYLEFASDLDFDDIVAIPLSALKGDNVIEQGPNLSWFNGPTILSQLETTDPVSASYDAPFRMPVQWVNRPNSEFRGFSGTVASGKVKPGDPVLAMTAISMRPSPVRP